MAVLPRGLARLHPPWKWEGLDSPAENFKIWSVCSNALWMGDGQRGQRNNGKGTWWVDESGRQSTEIVPQTISVDKDRQCAWGPPP